MQSPYDEENPFPLIGVALMFLGLLACHAMGAQSASDHARPSAEPAPAALLQQFGGRPPRPCPAITHTPSDAEAAILAQCTMEGPFGSTETLLTNIRVHITGSRAFSTNSAGRYTGEDNSRKDIDNRADVLTLTGSARQYACGVQSFSPGQSCTITEMPESPGACWKTTYGEYRCNFLSVGSNGYKLGPPPNSY